jgi:diguanylate cyclase (GGDEF)-like protein
MLSLAPNRHEPALPPDEVGRVATLRSLRVLDTEPEERFDRLTRIAMRMFSVPIAQISLIDSDRQWIKSSAGCAAAETPRSHSFCAHAILGSGVMLVPDARADERFSENPLVLGEPNIRFYAGYPLRIGQHHVGTLCLIDRHLHPFNAEDEQLLRDLARTAEEELLSAHLAATDHLTGLTNRRGLENFAPNALALCRRLQKPATFVYLDLDRFKQVNDRYGHAEGDRALTTFAQGLRTVFRESDIIARIGGDEFIVLLVDAVLASAAVALGRLRAHLAEVSRGAPRGYEIQFSVGLVEFDPNRHASIDDLLKEADVAMYQDKNQRHEEEDSSE